jgi:hypothetical protein
MKNITLFLFGFIIITFTSCSITEKMIIDENGAGKFSYEIDGSKMMSMVGSSFASKEKKPKKNKEKVERVSKDIDTTFSFKEMFASKKDSIAKLSLAEQEKIKRMEKFSVHTVINEEKGIMNYTMFTDFDSVKDLQDVMSPVNSTKSLSPTGQAGSLGMAPANLEDNSSTKFFYDGKKFRKEVSSLKKKEEKSNEEVSEESKELSEELKLEESLNMFYEQSNFKIVYQFPKAVKSISIENALFSGDRKSVTIEYPLKEYMTNPESLNFEIEFEN